MKSINELKDLNNSRKIDDLSSEEILEWYYHIKNSVDKLSKVFSEKQMNDVKLAISNFESRHKLL
jgi:hypothetical protein